MARCAAFPRTFASGTWCERNVPSTGRPSTSCGPVQPLGVRSTIAGHGRRGPVPWPRASPGIVRMRRSSRRASPRAPDGPARIAAFDESRRVAVCPRAATARRHHSRVRAPSDRDAYPFRCRIGSTAPSRAGLRKLTLFQDPASGPVSASPSPTTAATTRSGLSKAAPNAWASTYPSSPPS
jgi:hypothetical protein